MKWLYVLTIFGWGSAITFLFMWKWFPDDSLVREFYLAPFSSDDTDDNRPNRFKFTKEWYDRLNAWMLEQNPKIGRRNPFSVSVEDGFLVVTQSMRESDIDFFGEDFFDILSQEEFKIRMAYTPAYFFWESIDIECAFNCFRKEVIKRTRIGERDKFVRLPKSYESSLTRCEFIYTTHYEGRTSPFERYYRERYKPKTIGLIKPQFTKIIFDSALWVNGEIKCLAESCSPKDSKNVYVSRYFLFYEKNLSEFLNDLKHADSSKSYDFLVGVRGSDYPVTTYLSVLLRSDDGKSLVPVYALGEAAEHAYLQEGPSNEIAFWCVQIGTPIPGDMKL